MFNLVYAIAFSAIIISTAALATEARDRIYYKDGTWKDVVTDDRNSYIEKPDGSVGAHTGDTTPEGHQRLIDDEKRTGDVVKVERR